MDRAGRRPVGPAPMGAARKEDAFRETLFVRRSPGSSDETWHREGSWSAQCAHFRPSSWPSWGARRLADLRR